MSFLLNLIVALQLNVVTTTPELAYLAKEIGGNRVETQSLTVSAADLHQILPKASLLLKIRKADLLLSMGYDLEHTFLPALVSKARRSKEFAPLDGDKHLSGEMIPGMNPIEVLTKEQIRLMSGIDLHPRGNPHWNADPSRMLKYAEGLSKFFGRHMPEYANEFKERFSQWSQTLNAKMKYWRDWLRPVKGAYVTEYHKSWGYLAQFFGLETTTTVEPKPGIPPSAAHLVELSEEMVEKKVQALFLEPWYPASRLSVLQKAHKFTVIKVFPYSSGEAPYHEWMSNIVEQLAEAYGVPKPPLNS